MNESIKNRTKETHYFGNIFIIFLVCNTLLREAGGSLKCSFPITLKTL